MVYQADKGKFSCAFNRSKSHLTRSLSHNSSTISVQGGIRSDETAFFEFDSGSRPLPVILRQDVISTYPVVLLIVRKLASFSDAFLTFPLMTAYFFRSELPLFKSQLPLHPPIITHTPYTR